MALVVKNTPANAGSPRDTCSIPGLRGSPGGGHGNPLQYSCLENPMNKTAWRAIVHRIPKSWTGLKWHFIGNRWGNSGNSVRLYFLGSKITADGDCSLEIKRRLLLGRKLMTNLDSIFKSRGITLPTKVHLVKAMVFPVVMYGCESWTVKKAECRRIDAFELWCWRRLLRVPWTARKTLESPLDCWKRLLSVPWTASPTSPS